MFYNCFHFRKEYILEFDSSHFIVWTSVIRILVKINIILKLLGNYVYHWTNWIKQVVYQLKGISAALRGLMQLYHKQNDMPICSMAFRHLIKLKVQLLLLNMSPWESIFCLVLFGVEGGPTPCGMRNLSFLTRVWTCAHCSGNMES